MEVFYNLVGSPGPWRATEGRGRGAANESSAVLRGPLQQGPIVSNWLDSPGKLWPTTHGAGPLLWVLVLQRFLSAMLGSAGSRFTEILGTEGGCLRLEAWPLD